MFAIARLGSLLVMLGVMLPVDSADRRQTKLQKLATELEEVKQQLAELKAGNKIVAFSARFNGDDPQNGIPLSPQSPLKFDNVLLNVGNGYNALTGVTKAATWGDGSVDIHDQSTRTVPVQLNKGDEVWVAPNPGDGVRGNWWTMFSGFLVQVE